MGEGRAVTPVRALWAHNGPGSRARAAPAPDYLGCAREPPYVMSRLRSGSSLPWKLLWLLVQAAQPWSGA